MNGLFTALLVWPFIFIVVGLTFVSAIDVLGVASIGFWLVGFIAVVALILVAPLFLAQSKEDAAAGLSAQAKLEKWRRGSVTFAIALLLPIFVRYLVDTFDKSLGIIIAALIIAFIAALLGMFIKENKVLSYSNLIGGAISLGYVYTQLWELGELPRIIAAAFGLIVAVAVAIIKLRDKFL